MAAGGWSGWDGRPRPPDRGGDADARDAKGGEDPSSQPRAGSHAYESDWYRSLKALAARSDDPPGEDDSGSEEDEKDDDGVASGLQPDPALAAFGELTRATEAGEDEVRSGKTFVDPRRGAPPHDAITSLPDPSHAAMTDPSTAATKDLGAGPPPPVGTAEPDVASREPLVRPPQSEASPPAGREERPSLESISADLRRRALREIARNGLAASDVQRVLDMTLDPDRGVRAEALMSLRSQSDLLPEAAVRRILQDPVDDVRSHAVRLAASRGGRDLVLLLPLLGDRAAPLTQAAALDVVPEAVARADPLDDDGVRAALRAVGALASAPAGHEDAALVELAKAVGTSRLVRAVDGPDDGRLGAVRLLWLEGSPSSLRALAPLVDDRSEEIRSTAAQAVARARELERPPGASADSRHVERAAESEMLAALARALDDPDDRVRSRARVALLDVDRTAIVRWVRESLRADDDESARLAAEVARLLSLGETAPDLLAKGASLQGERRDPYRRALSSLPIDTEALVDALANVDPLRRPDAAQLVWIVAGRASLPFLQTSITDANPAVRIGVLQVLADSRDPGAAETARRVLASDSSPEVRVAAIGVLAGTSVEERLRSLSQGLRDPDPTVRATAVTRLPGDLGRAALGALTRALEDPDERVWLAALPHVAALPREDAAFVWKVLVSSRPEQRSALIRAMAEVDRSAISQLALAHAGALDASEREIALTLAGHGSTDECVQACIRSLQDPVVPVRRAAATSLAELRRPTSVAALGASLQDPEPQVRVAVLQALGVIDSEGVLGFLVRALQDPDPHVRDAASAVLTEWSSPAVARRLAGVLATPALRDQATDLLKKMGPSAAELLVDVLLRSTADMAPTIGSLLETIVGIEAFAARLDSADPQQRRRGVIAVAAIGGPRAVELAVAALADPDQHLRTAALEALADLHDPATAAAVERVAEHDPVFEVAETARWVLGKLRAPDAGRSVDLTG
jgi:HEAT repeat protein